MRKINSALDIVEEDRCDMSLIRHCAQAMMTIGNSLLDAIGKHVEIEKLLAWSSACIRGCVDSCSCAWHHCCDGDNVSYLEDS